MKEAKVLINAFIEWVLLHPDTHRRIEKEVREDEPARTGLIIALLYREYAKEMQSKNLPFISPDCIFDDVQMLRQV